METENKFRMEKMQESNRYKDKIIAQLKLAAEKLKSRCDLMEAKHGMDLSNMDYDGWAEVGNATVEIGEALKLTERDLKAIAQAEGGN